MAIPKFTEDLEIIQKLSDLPNSTDGLTAAELKARFDRAGLLLQKFINEQLVPNIVSREIPFSATNEIMASNIYDAILNVHSQIRDAATGTIVNGSVTVEKLSTELLERVYGGRPWVSVGTPGSADNAASGFPVGQIWLRPQFTVTNVATNNWAGTGCNVQASDHNLTITGNNTVASAKAVQALTNVGIDGDRVFILFDAGTIDPNIGSMTVSVNGMDAQNAMNGGVFETYLTGSSLNVQFDIAWPSTSLAGGSAQIRNFAVVNTTQVLRQMSEAKDMNNWPSYLRALQPITSHPSDAEVFIQASDGQWWPFGFETMAVSRGGTGLKAAENGSLLIGTGGEAMRTLPPAEDGKMLAMVGGQPEWADAGDALRELGFLHYKEGSYSGTGADRTVDLGITPKIVWIVGPSVSSYSNSTHDVSVTLLPGTKAGGTVPTEESGTINSGYAYVGLSGSKLSFTHQYGSYASRFMNENRKTYKWFALY